ncbi:MAG TPA: response regulator [Terriglobales bacterium]
MFLTGRISKAPARTADEHNGKAIVAPPSGFDAPGNNQMMPAIRSGAEVLLVDDNAADLDLTREVLGRHPRHLKMTSVCDGEQAMLFLRRSGQFGDVPRPDLIVLDLGLPGMDGGSVLRQIKTDSNLKDIPVIVFSTSHADQDVHGSYQHGATCYLRKPCNLTDFVAVVKSMADFWMRFAAQPQRKLK